MPAENDALLRELRELKERDIPQLRQDIALHHQRMKQYNNLIQKVARLDDEVDALADAVQGNTSVISTLKWALGLAGGFLSALMLYLISVVG